MDITSIGLIILSLLLIFFAIGMVLGKLFRRAEKDRAYVRTGFGGQKVILDGGSLVMPVFHNIAWVNLQTLRLDVRREAAEAMITKDRMRVDIGVEFYVRVKPDGASIALAAQTLGDRTINAEQLRELVEAKFVDALRSVAATMSLTDLQEKRADFVQAVQTAVARDLELNGLELESASLTKLDQTDTKYFNPNNAFDAEGLTALTRITEAKRQERNQTVRSAEVAIAQQDLEARQRTLEIERAEEGIRVVAAARHHQQDGRDARRGGAEGGRGPPRRAGGENCRRPVDRPAPGDRAAGAGDGPHRGRARRPAAEDRERTNGRDARHRQAARRADRRPGARHRHRQQEQGAVRGRCSGATRQGRGDQGRTGRRHGRRRGARRARTADRGHRGQAGRRARGDQGDGRRRGTAARPPRTRRRPCELRPRPRPTRRACAPKPRRSNTKSTPMASA